MSGKIKIIAAVLICVTLIAVVVLNRLGKDNDTESTAGESSGQTSAQSSYDLEMFSSIIQSSDSSGREESEDPNADNKTAAAFSEEFLTVYFNIDSTQTGKYDSVQHVNSYLQYMTDTAKEEFGTNEGEGDTADSISILRTMDMCKVYVSEEANNTSKTLCLAYVTTQINEAEPTDELLLIWLDLVYVNNTWLVNDVVNHNLYNVQAPLIELFE